MEKNEMYTSCVRSAGDRAGVFEYDGETGYFYLYDIVGSDGAKVLSAICITTSAPDFKHNDLLIHWDITETKVGLFVRNRLCAAFDLLTGKNHGGQYSHNTMSALSQEIVNAFQSE